LDWPPLLPTQGLKEKVPLKKEFGGELGFWIGLPGGKGQLI